MSNFPYNNDRYDPDKVAVNGSPLTLNEARGFADKILYWHTNERTADFSQSGDGFEEGVDELAFGLVELLSDPNAVKRLMSTGREVRRQVETALVMKDGIAKRWDNEIKPVIRKFLGKK